MAEKVKLTLEVDGKNVKVLDGAGKSLNKLNSTVGQSAGPLQSFKQNWKSAALVVGGAVFGFSKLVMASSNLQEATSKFNTVFTGHLAEASQSIDTLTKNYAMSTLEARKYMASIQDLLVPMGMSSDMATKMSDGVVKLAADLGSFNDLPTEKVMMDIQSALVGNFETMKKYGVVLNETRIKQEAMNAGLWDGKGVLNANIKAGVAYKLMVGGNEAALGDMIRTQDGFANTLKATKAEMGDLAADIGNQMLPMATSMLGVVKDWIKAFANLDVGMKEMIIKVGLFATAVGVLTKVVMTFGVTLQSAFLPVTLIVAGIVGLILAIKNWGKITDTFAALWGTAMDYIKGQFSTVLAVLQSGAEAMKRFFMGDFAGALEAGKEAFILLKEGANENFTALKEDLALNLDEIKMIWDETNIANTDSLAVNIDQQKQDYANLTSSVLANLNKQTSALTKAEAKKAKIKKKALALELANETAQTKALINLKEQFGQSAQSLGNSLISIAQDSGSGYRTLFEIGKAAAIAGITVDTAKATIAAVASMAGAGPVGWVIGAIKAASLVAAGGVAIAKVGSTQMPAAEFGGIIPGSAQGMPVLAGERNKSEAIIPLEGEGAERLGLSGGNTINVYIDNFYADDDEIPRKVAEAIDEGLEDLRRTQSSSFAVGLETQIAMA